MRKLLLLGTVALLMLPMGLMADQISIGGPSNGSLTYTSTGSGTTLDLTFSPSVNDSATFVLTGGTTQDSGTYSFTSTTPSPIVLTAAGSGVFDVTGGGSSTFAYASTTDTDKLSGTVDWTYVTDGSNTPTIHGVIPGFSVSGDSTFVAAFPPGDVFIDFNINGSCSVSPCTLNNLVTTSSGNTMSGFVSSGQAIAPEPSTTALLGTGLGLLLALAAL